MKPRTVHALRGLLAACNAAMVVATWPVWQRRASPPLLPLLPLPQLSVGAALLLAVAWAAWRPRTGVPAHALILLYAFLADETRLQPFVVSLTLLLWGASDAPSLRTVARVHLIALWFWGGVHKALSPVFAVSTAPWLLDGTWPTAPMLVRAHIGHAIVLAEVGTALLALVPRARRAAAACAVLVHVGALVLVSRAAVGRNVALWPWNVALALAAIALIAPWREGLFASLRACGPAARAVCVASLIAPAGYYAGVVGATFAHVLYTGSVAETVWCDRDGACVADPEQHAAIAALGVMVPPEPRVLRAYFRACCRPGERMVLHDPRADSLANGPSLEHIECPARRALSARETGRILAR